MQLYHTSNFNVNPGLKIFPGYNSAVNAVTRPNAAVWTTQYFVDRWLPLLGGNATMIVLVLRREGFFDSRTGERRDEIIMSRPLLAALTGLSEDTLTRELGEDKKTGKPRNPWLRLFVQPRRRARRNSRGQMQQIESAYWVSMDDPIHPDDWPLIEAAAEADGWRRDKALAPETQNAFPAEDLPKNGCETPEKHFTPLKTQNAAPETQNASPLKIYPPLLNNTFSTTDKDGQGCLFVVGSSLDFEDQNEDAAMKLLKQRTNQVQAPESAPAQAPQPPPPLVLEPQELPAPPSTHPEAPSIHPEAPSAQTADPSGPGRLPAFPSDLDAAVAVDAASQKLMDKLACDADAEVYKMRQAGDSDADIAQILIDALAETLRQNKKAGYAIGTIRKMSVQHRAEKSSAQTSLESQIAGKLERLPAVNKAELDDIRARHGEVPADVKADMKKRAEKMIHEAAGSLAAYNAIPKDQFSEIWKRLLPAIFLDWETKAGCAGLPAGGC